jgi:hypothetical protein
MLLLFLVSVAFPCSEEEEGDYIPLQEGLSQEEICSQNSNFYTFELSSDEILLVDVLFSHVQGDLDIYLYDADTLEILRTATSSSDNEHIYFRTFEDTSLLIEVAHHPSVTNTSDLSISYVMDIQVNLGLCEDSLGLWYSSNEDGTSSDTSEGDSSLGNGDISNNSSEEGSYPLWSYTKESSEPISFSSEELSETEMFFEESICFFSEHWYEFVGNIGENIEFELTYPKEVELPSNSRNDRLEEESIIAFETPILQGHLFDELGNLLRIISFEESDDGYQGQTSFDFLSNTDISNVFLQIFMDNEQSIVTTNEIAIPYDLTIFREFFSVCVDDDFVGNVGFEEAVDIDTGSYVLQACTDDYFIVFLEGNYDIRLEHDLEDGELDLILYNDLFHEVSRSTGGSGEELISVLGEGNVYIQIYLQEDIHTEGVPYVLSIYPTSVTEEEPIDEEDRIYMDTGSNYTDNSAFQKSGCSVVGKNMQNYSRIFVLLLGLILSVLRRKVRT